MESIPILKSSKVVLCPLASEDVALLRQWFFEPDVLQWLQISEDPPEYRTVEAIRERFERMQADPSSHVWRIDTAAGQPIGQIELVEINRLQRRAEMHLLIGENKVRGNGYGSEAIRLLLKHAFEELKLRRVYLIVDEDNQRAIRCFEKAGFIKEGLLRHHRLRNGQPINMFIMGSLNEDVMNSETQLR